MTDGLSWGWCRKGGFLFARHTLPLLLRAEHAPYPPTLIFTGATASVRGGPMFASYASAKFALRALAQSLGREFGPKGVHVAHAIIDGIIDIPRTKGMQASGGAAPDAKIDPDAVSIFGADLPFFFLGIRVRLPVLELTCLLRADCGCVLASPYPATEHFHARD